MELKSEPSEPMKKKPKAIPDPIATALSLHDSPSSKVFSIPELIDIIGRFLTTNDRLHLSMTNRMTHQTVTPLFWSSLDLSDKLRTQRLLQSRDVHGALYKHFSRVQELRLQTSTLVYIINSMIRHQAQSSEQSATFSITPVVTDPHPLPQSPLPNPLTVTLPRIARLTSLEFVTEQSSDGENGTKDTYPNISVMPRLTWLLNVNPHLTHIRVSGCRVRSPFDAHLFIQALPTLKSLKELQLSFRMSPVRWEIVVELLFYCLPVSIETLSLHSSKAEDSFTPPPESQDTELTGFLGTRRTLGRRYDPLDRLTKLQIEFGRWEDTRLLLSLFRDCPALEIFTPPSWDADGFRSISVSMAQLVTKNCPRLSRLESCGQGALDIIKAIPQHSLKSLISKQPCASGIIGLSLQAVTWTQFNSLTEVRIQECAHISGSAIQAILWTCVALEHLVIKGQTHQTPVASRLKHLVEQMWVCLRLKTLEITIDMRQIQIPAADLGFMPAVHEPTWIMLKKFYRQLGVLTELEVLNLTIKSKEMQWLDNDGKERTAIGDKPIAPPKLKNRIYTSNFQEDNKIDDDNWSAGEGENNTSRTRRNKKSTQAINADASFPGLLSLGDSSIGRPGYLSWLSGLTKLREIRGHVQATTTETSKTLGRTELEWMLKHWPKLKVIELQRAYKSKQSMLQGQRLIERSLPHLAWFQQQHQDIQIIQDCC